MEKPKCTLVGENGNIFNLIGIASRTLRNAGQQGKAKDMCRRITTQANNYEEALVIISEYVEVE